MSGFTMCSCLYISYYMYLMATTKYDTVQLYIREVNRCGRGS